MRLPRELKEFDFMKKEQRRRQNHGYKNKLPSSSSSSSSSSSTTTTASERLEQYLSKIFYVILKICQAILSIYLSLVLIPLLALFWLVNEIVRALIISPLLRRKYGRRRYELVGSGQDNIWSFRKPGNSRNILLFSVFNKTNYNNNIDVESYAQNFLANVINLDEGGRRPYHKLTQILTNKLGYFVWENTCNDGDGTNEDKIEGGGGHKKFDIKNHIRVLNTKQVLGGKDFVSESDLPKILSELTTDMSENSPQWEEIIIPRFVYDHDGEEARIGVVGSEGDGNGPNHNKYEKSAKIFRFHHGYMDEISALSMMTRRTCSNTNTTEGQEAQGSSSSALDLDPFASLKLSRWKFMSQLLHLLAFGTLKLVRAMGKEMYTDSRFLTPRFKGHILHAWSDPINISDLQRIRRKIGAGMNGNGFSKNNTTTSTTKNTTTTTTTEICICALAAALRAVSWKFCKKAPWLIFPDTLEGSCFIGLIRSFLPYPREGPMNRFGVVGFDIDTTPIGEGGEEIGGSEMGNNNSGVDNWTGMTRLQRFESARKLYEEQIGASPLVLLNYSLQKYIGRFPVVVIQYLLRDYGAPVVLNNIPWIQTKLELMGGGGEQLEEFAVWMPMVSSTGLGITTAKYRDKMRFCAVTEMQCLSSIELKYFLNAMRSEIMAMLNECGGDDDDDDDDGTQIITSNNPVASKVHQS